jgi:hypothetical protein
MIRTESDVVNAKTSELVEFYNAHTDKPITKFADRRTAETRVLKLLHSFRATVEIDHLPQNKPVAQSEDKQPTANRKRSGRYPSLHDAQVALWKIEEVRTARCERSAVDVDGETYSSVRAAFAALELPMSRHIKFRGQLKEEGKLTAFGHDWEIVPLNY